MNEYPPTADAEELFAQVVDEFTDRLNGGESPRVEEYTARYPLLAADLRAVLGMLPALRSESTAGQSLRPDAAGESTLPNAAAGTVVQGESGPQVAGFTLHGELGRGGMGVVYHATQVMLGRPVALKMVLSGAHATAEERVRFLNEAGVLAKFQHPHIVPVYEFGSDPDGRPYFALEYLAGGSLAGQLQAGPLPPAAAAGVVKALAAAVGYAHARGVIHRDLKPANVLYAADGTPKVTDFGLAKRTDAGDGFTATYAVLGTPSYMSPEQASGVTAAVGPPADVYALGAILYECLTGRPPFRGVSVFDTLAQVRTREPIGVRELQPSVPKDLETVCLKCLQKDPAKRYSSAEALADDLERFLDGRAIQARPVSAVEKGWRWCKRNRLVASLGGLATGLLLAVAVGSAVAALWYRATLETVQEAKDKEQEAKDDAEDKLWRSYRAKAEAVRNGGRMGQRVESLAALKAAGDIVRRRGGDPNDLSDLRNDVIATLALPDVRYGAEVSVRLAETASREDPLTFDPDYTLAAVDDVGVGLRFVSTADGREVGRVTTKTVATNGLVRRKFSRDGKVLAVNVGGAYALYTVPGGKRLSLVRGVTQMGQFDFDPAAERVYVGGTDAVVRGSRVDNGKEEWQLDLKPFRVNTGKESAVAVSPDGTRLAVCPFGGTGILVFRPDTKELLNTVPLAANPVAPAVVWHPNGQWVGLTYGEGADRADVFDAATDRLVARLEGNHTVTHLSFHPNGWVAAAVGWDNTTRFWNLYTGKPVLTLPYITGHPWFSRDGRFYGCTVTPPFRVQEFVDCAEYRSLGMGRGSGSGSEHSPPRLSPDGRLLATQTPAGTHLHDLPSGRLLATFGNTGGTASPAHTPGRYPAVWAADGSALHFLIGSSLFARAAVRLDGGVLTVGPPRPLWPTTAAIDDVQVLPDGKTVVAATGGTFDLETGRERVLPQMPRYRAQHKNAVHPDGTLVATAGWHDPTVTVWEPANGRRVKEIEFGRNALPTFTPDGRHLVLTRTNSYTFFDTRTWEEWKRIPRQVATHPGPITFSPDGTQVVLEVEAGVLTLFSCPDYAPLARLQSPGRERAGFDRDVRFSPDGGALLFRTEPSTGGYRVWDLRAVRRGLAEFDLDWDAPAYPPLAAVPPITAVRVIGNETVATYQRAKKGGEQWAALALAADPFDPAANRALANWCRDYGRHDDALAHAALSVAAEPAQLDLLQFLCSAGIELRQWEDVARWATLATDQFPESVEAVEFRYHRAVAALCRKKPDDALADLDAAWKVVADWKTRPDLRGLVADARAVALLALDRKPEAAEAQSKAIELGATVADFRRRAGSLLFGPPAFRHPVLGQALAKFVVEDKTATEFDHFVYDLAMYRAGRWADAAKRITPRLKTAGGTARGEVLLVLALCHAAANDAPAAEAAFKDAEKLWQAKRPTVTPRDRHRVDYLAAEAKEAVAASNVR